MAGDLNPAKLTLLALTALAALYDARTRKIPNWLSLTGCATGLTLNSTLAGLPGLKLSLFGLATGFALYLPLWLLHARGAGDVKLLAAAGSIIGPQSTLVLALIAAVTGGVLALALVIAKGATHRTALNIAHILSSLARFRRPNYTLASAGALRLPHAMVIFLSAVILVTLING